MDATMGHGGKKGKGGPDPFPSVGGKRLHLDLGLVATLTQQRQEFLDGIENPTAADKMLADTAVLAIATYCGSREPVSESSGATG